MSIIAKIFIVINLVLSVVFVGVSGTLLTQKADYKTKYEEVVKVKTQMNKFYDAQVKDLTEQVSQESATRKLAEDSRSKYKAQWDEQLSRVNDLTKELNHTKGLFENLSEAQDELNRRVREAFDRNEALNGKLTTALGDVNNFKGAAERAKNKQKEVEILFAEKEDKIHSLNGQLASQDRELGTFKRTIELLQEAGVDVARIAGGGLPPAVDTTVTAVNEEVGLVMLGIGREAGLRKGHDLTVFRGDQFVGRVVVEQVYNDMASARIDRKYLVDKIQVGDNVTTRIR
jgi:predicted RNase H-like nuclease (RuvC/YqgF family)